MPSRDITLLDKRLFDSWMKAVDRFTILHPDIIPKVSCTYRSPEEQDADYAIGRTVPGKDITPARPMGRTITNARARQSPHNFIPAQAYDYFFVDEKGKAIWNNVELYKEFSAIVISIDPTLVYGGSFKSIGDNDHIECPDWWTLK